MCAFGKDWLALGYDGQLSVWALQFILPDSLKIFSGVAIITKLFNKPFTQQEAIPDAGVAAAIEVLRSGRLHRYNTADGEASETELLEKEYAAYQGRRYCLAVTSGGQALQIALRAAGVLPGDKVLANAYTLAPVPGALHAVGAVPQFVEISDDWCVDLADLERQASTGEAGYLLLSHMRGRIADMDAIAQICKRHDIVIIEDCAHTMGARWNGVLSGNTGVLACFSTQTYKHLNSGEGGLLCSNDPRMMAQAILLSGSYMLYERHGAAPAAQYFAQLKWTSPNCSARMDNLRAAILRAQLPCLDANIRRWNERYRVLLNVLRGRPGIRVIERDRRENFVGSSFQFHTVGMDASAIQAFIGACEQRGVELKWFGRETPHGFTSRFDSWRYLAHIPELPQTRKVLATTVDFRVPLTFSVDDCRLCAEIIAEQAAVYFVE